MQLIPSRVRRVRSERGLPQRGGFVPLWKILKMPRQRGGWISQDVSQPPGYDFSRLLARGKYKNRSQCRRGTSSQRKRPRRRRQRR